MKKSIPRSQAVHTVILEANNGGIPETVDSSVGMLVDPTVEVLVNTLQDLWSHPNILENIRKNCRPYAEGCFGLGNTRIIERAYRNCANEFDKIDAHG